MLGTGAGVAGWFLRRSETFTGDEGFSWVRMLLIIGLVGCIVGLKLVSDAEYETTKKRILESA